MRGRRPAVYRALPWLYLRGALAPPGVVKLGTWWPAMLAHFAVDVVIFGPW